eukprot:m.198979 g.198979  ORF g.198979 m.198979 type:complete len:408 (+) comp32715_c0_seq5:211-1434(+)
MMLRHQTNVSMLLMALLLVSAARMVNAASASVVGVDIPAPDVSFGWGTVGEMVFFHADNITGPYSDAAVDTIAKFPLVTIEKWHGACGGSTNQDCPAKKIETYPCCEEDRIVDDLQRIKLKNPNTTTIIYFNLVLDFPQYRLHQEMMAKKDWPLVIQNGSIPHMWGDSGPRMELFDLGNADVRQGFVSACVDAVVAGKADGCFIDRAISCLPTQACAVGECGCDLCPFLSHEQSQTYIAGHAQLLTQLQTGIGFTRPLIANHAITLNTTNSAQLENYFQGKSGGVDGIKALLQCTYNNKLCEAHVTIGSDCTNITQPLAAFLIGVGRLGYFGCGKWHVSDNTGGVHCDNTWFYNASRGLHTTTDNCTFTRTFASGSVATWDGSSNSGSIAWGIPEAHEDPHHSCDTT